MTTPKLSKMHQRVNASKEERAIADIEKTAPPNTFWDDAENVYQTSMQGIDQSHGVLAEHLQAILSDPAERAKIKDMAGLTSNIELLGKDINNHVNKLNEIHKLHEGRTGGTVTPDEHMLMLDINGKYFEAIEIYQSVILPTVSHIFEQTGMIDEVIDTQSQVLSQQQQADLIDPNVITDVVVKE